MGDDVRSLLIRLATAPGDVAARQRAAEALDNDGDHDQACELLAPLVNLTAHDDEGELPCLCKRCLPAAGRTAAAGGFDFVRSFAVSGDRVLHFWMLAEQAGQRAAVRASVAGALRARMAGRKR